MSDIPYRYPISISRSYRVTLTSKTLRPGLRAAWMRLVPPDAQAGADTHPLFGSTLHTFSVGYAGWTQSNQSI